MYSEPVFRVEKLFGDIHGEPILEAGEVLAQRVPRGLEAFAVTTPRVRKQQGQSRRDVANGK